MRRIMPALACVTGVLAVAGCGSSGSNSSSTSSTTPAAKTTATAHKTATPGAPASTGFKTAVKLSSDGATLKPRALRIAKPGQITFDFTNKGTAAIAIEVKGPGVDEESDVVDNGQTTALTVELPKGTYNVSD